MNHDLSSVVGALSGDLQSKYILSSKYLVSKSRRLVSTNPIASTASKRWVSSMVGNGIKVLWGNKKVQAAWDIWAKSPNADGYGDLLAFQTLASKLLFEDGEAFIKFAYNGEVTKQNPLPLRLQIVDGSMLADSGSFTLSENLYSIGGITFDYYMKPISYSFYKSNIFGLYSTPIDIPASEVIHLFKKEYSGQVRGIPYLAPVMAIIDHLNELFLATLERQKSSQALSYIVRRQGAEPFPFLGDNAHQETQDLSALQERRFKQIQKIKAGSVAYLNLGEDIQVVSPQDIGDSLSKVFDGQLQQISASLDLTFEQLSNNLSEVNYSSARVGMLTANRLISQQQQILLISVLLTKLTNKFLTLYSLEFGDRYKNTPVTFQVPKTDHVDREKEVRATILELQAGLTTLEIELAKRNLNYEDILTQLQKEHNIDIVLEGNKNSKSSKKVKTTNQKMVQP